MHATMPEIHAEVSRMRDREALRAFIDLDRPERDTAPRNTANMAAADLFLLGPPLLLRATSPGFAARISDRALVAWRG